MINEWLNIFEGQGNNSCKSNESLDIGQETVVLETFLKVWNKKNRVFSSMAKGTINIHPRVTWLSSTHQYLLAVMKNTSAVAITSYTPRLSEG